MQVEEPEVKHEGIVCDREGREGFRFDLLVVVALLSFPLIIWVTMMPLASRFTNTTAGFTSFGQITGLLGMAMVALGMAFQLRLPFLCRLMAKPTTVASVHHNLGVMGLFLLMLHPLFLSYRYLPISLQLAFAAIYQPSLSSLIGLIALLSMIVAMWVTLMLPRNFSHWKGFHLLFVFAYLLSLYHIIFVTSDTSNSLLLYLYMLGLSLIGLTFFVYQKSIYLWKKYLPHSQ